jgi:methanethiol S-methyltransferase
LLNRSIASVAFWSTPNMTIARFGFAVMTTAYIIVVIQFEERDLKHEYGADYEEYRRRVPMLLPIGNVTPAASPAVPPAARRS